MDKTTEMVGLKYVAPHPARVKPEDTVPEARWDVNTMTEEGYQMLIEDYTIEATAIMIENVHACRKPKHPSLRSPPARRGSLQREPPNRDGRRVGVVRM
jgi:hypothetical protein